MVIESREKANIIRRTVKESLKMDPITDTPFHEMTEAQLVSIVLCYTPLLGISSSPSNVIGAYEALRKIDKVRYPEINYEDEKWRQLINPRYIPPYLLLENPSDPASGI
jgi:hypothetical protein